MKEKFTFQQKTKLLTKLFDAGCNTEKKLQQLDMESILKIPGITIPDMSLIIELQKQTKVNKLLMNEGKSTDAVDDLIIKVGTAPKKKFKVIEKERSCESR